MSAGAADALHLHVDDAGTGTPLVLLHGFTGSSASWASLREQLGDGMRTIAIDLPGHGASEAPEDPCRYALPRVADDVVAVLDRLRLERVALMGYSMGGRAALHLAVRHPDRVSALVLESASPGIVNENERVERIRADVALAESIERDGVDAFVARWEALPLWESQRALPDDVRVRLRAQRRANPARGLANSLRGAGAGAERSLEPRLGGLAMPVLVVAGALDEKYVGIGRSMARALPDATLEVVEGTGHAVHLERPAELSRLVRDFLGA